MEYAGNVSKTLEPTYENVTKEFIQSTLYILLCNSTKTNFRMRFEELEAMQYITGVLQESAKGGTYWERKPHLSPTMF